MSEAFRISNDTKVKFSYLIENTKQWKRGTKHAPHNKWDNDASWSSPHTNDYHADQL